MRCKWVVLSLVIACASALPNASAQPAATPTAPAHDDPAKRLFEEGRDLMKAGRYDEACPKLDESQTLRPGVGTLFNLAECNTHIGKLATAHRQFLEVAEKTAADGDAERERVAREKAAALEPKLMKVALSVPSASDSLEVKIDGEVIPRDKYTQAIPLDAGSHTITATAPDEDPFSSTVELSQEGSVTTVTIPIGGDAAPPAEEEPKTYRKMGHLIAGSILTGLGAVLLVTGIVALAASGDLAGVDSDNAIVYGAVATPVGAVMLAPGIPLFISGLKARPVEPAQKAEEEARGDVPPRGWSAGASVTFSF